MSWIRINGNKYKRRMVMSIRSVWRKVFGKPEDVCHQCGVAMKIPKEFDNDFVISVQSRAGSLVCKSCQKKYNKK